MSRYWKYNRNNYRSKKLSKKEEFQWLVVAIVFTVCFVFYFTTSYFSNCIFEWPIRWDVKTCWNEQIPPAKERAIEKATNFIP